MTTAIDRPRAATRRMQRLGWLVAALVVLAGGARWMVSAPIDAAGPPPSWSSAEAEARPLGSPLLEADGDAWPDGPISGPGAKRRLERALRGLVARLERLDGYEAVIRRRERIGGLWLSEQTLRMKVRHRPASVYLKDIGVEDGCEILHVEGQRDGKLLLRPPGGGLIGLLLPSMELDPHAPLAMTQSRFPITEAGLLPVARRLLVAAERERDDPGASVVLDRVVEADGRAALRSVQRYDGPGDGRPFARVEVRYDPETLVPRSYTFHDWPPSPDAPATLGGRYAVESFDPDAAPADRDFDPTNPAYRFR